MGYEELVEGEKEGTGPNIGSVIGVGGRKRKSKKHNKKSHKKSHKKSKRHYKRGGSILGLTAAEATPIVLGIAAAMANNKLPPRVNNLLKKTPVLNKLANKVKSSKKSRRRR
tara:strand:- start:92 stop:427 length:336 start_codon:yes stop_codon:yes gene_type:complete